MRSLPATLCLAEEVGERLERSQILLGTLPPQRGSTASGNRLNGHAFR
jgi:hypothetical protein